MLAEFRVRSVVLGICTVLVTTLGCQRSQEIQFAPRTEIAELANPHQKDLIKQYLDKHTGTPGRPKLMSDAKYSVDRLLAGQAVYQKRCVQCHGDSGNGAGPAAVALNPKPRDYRNGLFKFKSTINKDNPGSTSIGDRPKPTHADLVAVIRRGAIGTSMPAFPLLSDQDVNDVVEYVKYLSQRGEMEYRIAMFIKAEEDVFEELTESEGGNPKDPEDKRKVKFVEGLIDGIVTSIADSWNKADDFVLDTLTKEPAFTLESVARGKAAFLSNSANCKGCHGEDGRGIDLKPEELANFKDDWGNPSRAADLSAGMFHGGGKSIDIYRRIMIGVQPMPARYSEYLSEPDTVWDLVHYVQYISSARRRMVKADSVFNVTPKATTKTAGASE